MANCLENILKSTADQTLGFSRLECKHQRDKYMLVWFCYCYIKTKKIQIIIHFPTFIKEWTFCSPKSRKDNFKIRDTLKFEEPYKTSIMSLFFLLDCWTFHHGHTLSPNAYLETSSQGGKRTDNKSGCKIQKDFFWARPVSRAEASVLTGIPFSALRPLPAQPCTLPHSTQPHDSTDTNYSNPSPSSPEA